MSSSSVETLQFLRTISLDAKELTHDTRRRLIEEVLQQAKRTVVEEALRIYKVHVPDSRIDATIEEDVLSSAINIRVKIHAKDITNLLVEDAMMRHPVMIMDDYETIVNDIRNPRDNVKTLHALLDELLPTWRSVYDRVKPTTINADWPVYRRAPWWDKPSAPEARKGEDSPAKDEFISPHLRRFFPSRVWEYHRPLVTDPMGPKQIHASHGTEGKGEGAQAVGDQGSS